MDIQAQIRSMKNFPQIAFFLITFLTITDCINSQSPPPPTISPVVEIKSVISPAATWTALGLSEDEFATLNSLVKVDDHPLYSMHYFGEYDPSQTTYNPPEASQGWACSLFATLGGATGFLLMLGIALLGELIWKKEALGGGDVKMMAALGLLIGWKGILMALFMGSAAGAVPALLLIAFKKLERGAYLPFGPFLALGAWLYWMGWYPAFLLGS